MIRDIQILRWKDPLAWMESMKGPRWASTVASENLRFQTAVASVSTKERYEASKNKFILSQKEGYIADAFQRGPVLISPAGTLSYKWRWEGNSTTKEAAEIFCVNDTVFSVEADEQGNEVYSLACYTKKGLLWRYKRSIAPYIYVHDNICYVIEAVGTLQYRRLVCINAEDGKGRRILFTEESERHNLLLNKNFLISDNSGTQKLYRIDGLHIKRVCEEGVSFIPLGETSCFFARIGSLDAEWTPFGDELKSYIFPSLKNRIVSFSFENSLLLLSAGGIVSVYQLSKKKLPVKIREFVGSCISDDFSTRYLCLIPGATPALYDGKKLLHKEKTYAKHELRTCISSDGTRVPYVLVSPNKKGKGLMVVMYGGYGIPTKMDTSRWRPYIETGWSIVFALIRGGGDFGDSWADAARTYKKTKSVEDAEAVIRSAQRYTQIDTKSTCIYGRSAGGYIVGSLVARHPTGGLLGASYAEVPYVDILRTTTNPSLPLTVLEYNEFGNPAEKLEDLEAILRLSPVDSLGEEGAPAVFVLARTSLNDKEVLAYESVKWITRLRGSYEGEPKLLALTGGQGHFIHGSLDIEQKVADFILLSAWLSSRV